ncbi:hypothetical protein BDN70DRAFT_602603 [Pholiota conissans]|uniref:Uncharacterized protein n=1 Tax=Pholiota conissans TaxID=109636 RepID=A0A9P5YP40_9AGAR|nr:hypothetical protein BDN70DRAFT_602603 [Pholiota conissans]
MARNQELEDALRSTKSELDSKAQVLDALTARAEAQWLQIYALKSDLQDALAIRKDAEEQQDSALVRAHASEDAHGRRSSKSRRSHHRLQSTAVGDCHPQIRPPDALAVFKLREEERDAALIHISDAKGAQEAAQAHIYELDDALKPTTDELSSKSQALDALTATSWSSIMLLPTASHEKQNATLHSSKCARRTAVEPPPIHASEIYRTLSDPP